MRIRPGAARTILLFYIISAGPSKQPRMVGSTLGVYSFGLIFVSARTNKRHHHHVRCRNIISQRWSPFCEIVVRQQVIVKLFEGLKGRAVSSVGI